MRVIVRQGAPAPGGATAVHWHRRARFIAFATYAAKASPRSWNCATGGPAGPAAACGRQSAGAGCPDHRHNSLPASHPSIWL